MLRGVLDVAPISKLTEEVDTFIESYRDRLDDEFKSQYGYDFSPELWETTIYEFLTTVRRLALI
ncbi:contact-dependent growth inhibition system immunity protein [Klebsiella aerogenes]|uniref:contact-dependent growth inhibition system immunity protein n=1 Tax=Klebsiella aerogenes TaxID=548 RepID=UPI002DB6CFBF|nr:contact-dependent growth inhibition system immunity protein [Klebsiella aerogenes]MEB5696143.1 contact-dependent growth inhibition system immunity protein [Klebsiella aerogenes]